MVLLNYVSDWFLSKESMTHKKLQKLCYYAQAWYCALYDDGPLFENEIQAWVHGPVVPDLYHQYSRYGWEKIPQKMDFDDSCLNEKAINVLESVYETYGEYDGDQLEVSTHSEEPWISARKGLKPWEPGTEPIKYNVMRNFYKSLYEQGQAD